MYQHWAYKERDNSSKYSEDVIKMIEMFSEKKKNSSSKKKSYCFIQPPLLGQFTIFIQFFLKSFPAQPPSTPL